MTDTTTATPLTADIGARELAQALAMLLPCAATEQHLPEISGVTVDTRGASLTLWATDRYVMARYDLGTLDASAGEHLVTVPLDAAKQWLKMVKAHKYDAPMTLRIVDTGDGTPRASLSDGDNTAGASCFNVVSRYANLDRLWQKHTGADTASIDAWAWRADVVATLATIAKVAGRPKRPATMRFRFTGPNAPVCIDIPDVDSFSAIAMPAKAAD